MQSSLTRLLNEEGAAYEARSTKAVNMLYFRLRSTNAK
jgi:hypothetical protein